MAPGSKETPGGPGTAPNEAPGLSGKAAKDAQDRLQFWMAFLQAGGRVTALEWIRLTDMDRAALVLVRKTWREIELQQEARALAAVLYPAPSEEDELRRAAQGALNETR